MTGAHRGWAWIALRTHKENRMNQLSLAWRNILRNRRRSALTLAAVCVAAVAILVLGGYVRATVRALETDTVRQTGHLPVMTQGYLQFGRGNPGRFAIREHEAVAAALRCPRCSHGQRHHTGCTCRGGGHFASGTSSNFRQRWDPCAQPDAGMEWHGCACHPPLRT
jgi:putative ABC transport system permease protein